MNPFFDELAEPRFREEFLDVGLADAGRHAGEKSSSERRFQAAEGAFEHVNVPASLVADQFVALDGDERGGVAEFSEASRDFVRDALSVREDLEIAIGMVGEDIEKPRVEERLAAQNAKEAVAFTLGVRDEAIHVIGGNLVRIRCNVHPATLAAEVAAIQDGDVEEGRKVLAFLHASFESFDADNALDPKVPQELSDAAGRGGAEDAECEFCEHGGGEGAVFLDEDG
jgi:hypothetical protein